MPGLLHGWPSATSSGLESGMSKSGPHRLTETGALLSPALELITKTITPDFYQQLDADFDGCKGHVLVAEHAFEGAWPTWEMHPKGDELVYLLEGDCDMVLRTANGDVTIRLDAPGQYVVVPRGVWHTATPHVPSRMLFMTPGEGTRNEVEPPAT